jgi:hypothetical protein
MPPCAPPIPAPATPKSALLVQVQQLTKTIQALQDQLNAQPMPLLTPFPMPTPAAEIKITMPDLYDGSSDKMEHYLHQCDVYFLGSPALSDHQCMTFAISYMSKGCVLSWVEWMMEEVMHPDFVANWGTFKNNMRMAFSNLDCAMMARLKIKEVKQGRESMDDYIIHFKEFEGFMSFNDMALVKVFKEGLAPPDPMVLLWS